MAKLIARVFSLYWSIASALLNSHIGIEWNSNLWVYVTSESGVAETSLKVSESRHNSNTLQIRERKPTRHGEKPIKPLSYTCISTVEQL